MNSAGKPPAAKKQGLGRATPQAPDQLKSEIDYK